MRKILCAVTLAVACLGIGVSPAQAAHGCVTRAEYHAVHFGMTKGRVHRIFDTAGHRSAFIKAAGITTEVRGYRACRRHTGVSVAYLNGKLKTKSGFLL